MTMPDVTNNPTNKPAMKIKVSVTKPFYNLSAKYQSTVPKNRTCHFPFERPQPTLRDNPTHC